MAGQAKTNSALLRPLQTLKVTYVLQTVIKQIVVKFQTKTTKNERVLKRQSSAIFSLAQKQVILQKSKN